MSALDHLTANIASGGSVLLSPMYNPAAQEAINRTRKLTHDAEVANAVGTVEGQYTVRMLEMEQAKLDAENRTRQFQSQQHEYWRTIDRLESDVGTLDRQLRTTNDELNAVTNETRLLAEDNLVLKDVLDNVTNELNTTQGNLQHTMQIEAEQERRTLELEAAYRVAQTEIAVLQEKAAQLERLEVAHAALQATNQAERLATEGLRREHLEQKHAIEEARLRAELRAEQQTARLDETSKRLATVEAQHIAAINETTRARNAEDAARGRAERAEGELEELTAQLQELQKEADELSRQLADVSSARAILEQQQATAVAAVAEAEHKGRMETERAQLEADARIAEVEARLAQADMWRSQVAIDLDIARMAATNAQMERERVQADADQLPAAVSERDRLAVQLRSVTMEREALHTMMLARMGMEEELAAAKDRSSALEQELVPLRERFAQLVKDREALNLELVTIKDALKATTSDREVRLLNLSEWKTALERERDELKGVIVGLNDKLDETRRQREAATAEFARAQGALDEAEKELAHESERVQELTGSNQLLADEMAAAREESARYSAELEAGRVTLTQLEQKLRGLLDERGLLVGEVEAGRARAGQLEHGLEEMASAHAAERQAFQYNLGEAQKQLREEMNRAQQAMELEHARAFGVSKKTIDAMGAELLTARANAAHAEAELRRTQERLENAEKFVDGYARDVNIKTREAQEYKLALDVATRERTEAQEEADALRVRITNMTMDATDVQRALNVTQEQLNEVGERNVDYEGQLATLDAVVTTLKDEVENMADEVARANSEKAAAHQRAADALNEIQRLAAAHASAATEASYLRDQNADLRASLSNTQGRREHFEQRTLQLEQDYADAAARLRTAEEVASTLRTERDALEHAMAGSWREREEQGANRRRIEELQRELLHEQERLNYVAQEASSAAEFNRVAEERVRAADTEAKHREREVETAVRANHDLRAELERQTMSRQTTEGRADALAIELKLVHGELAKAERRSESLEASLAAAHAAVAEVRREGSASQVQAVRGEAELQFRVQDLQSQLAAANERLRQGAVEREAVQREFEKQLTALEARLSTSDSVRVTLEAERDPTRQEIHELRSAMRALENDKARAETEADRLNAALEELRGAYSELLAETNTTKTTLAEARQHAANLTAAMATSEQRGTASAKDAAYEKQQAEFAAERAREREQELLARVTRERELGEANVARVVETMRAVERARDDLLGYREMCTALEKQLAENRASLKQLQQENLALTSTLASREAALNAAETNAFTNGESLEACQLALRRVDKEKRVLAATLERLTGEYEAAGNALRARDAERAELTRQVGELTRTAAEARANADVFRSMAPMTPMGDRSFGGEGRSFELDRARLADQVAVLERENQSLRSAKERLEEEARALRGEAAAYGEEVKRMMESCAGYQELIGTLTNKYEAEHKERQAAALAAKDLEDTLKVVLQDKKAVESHRMELMQVVGDLRYKTDTNLHAVKKELAVERARTQESKRESHDLRVQLEKNTVASTVALKRELDAKNAQLGQTREQAQMVIGGLRDELRASTNKAVRHEESAARAISEAAQMHDQLYRSENARRTQARDIDQERERYAGELKSRDRLLSKQQSELASATEQRDDLALASVKMAGEAADLQRALLESDTPNRAQATERYRRMMESHGANV